MVEQISPEDSEAKYTSSALQRESTIKMRFVEYIKKKAEEKVLEENRETVTEEDIDAVVKNLTKKDIQDVFISIIPKSPRSLTSGKEKRKVVTTVNNKKRGG